MYIGRDMNWKIVGFEQIKQKNDGTLYVTHSVSGELSSYGNNIMEFKPRHKVNSN